MEKNLQKLNLNKKNCSKKLSPHLLKYIEDHPYRLIDKINNSTNNIIVPKKMAKMFGCQNEVNSTTACFDKKYFGADDGFQYSSQTQKTSSSAQ